MNHSDCIFCRIIERQAPAYVIDENDHVIVFLSLENHPLVVPKAHIPDIYAMPSDIGAYVMAETIRIAKAVKKGLRCDGVYINQCNEPAAGQDVFHYHAHIYPCWDGEEIKAITHFFRSVTHSGDVTETMKATMLEKIQASLAEDNID